MLQPSYPPLQLNFSFSDAISFISVGIVRSQTAAMYFFIYFILHPNIL
jgi:hypothetical protein